MNEKIKYQNLLNNLNNIASNLYSSIRSLENALNEARTAINIDSTIYKRSSIENAINNLKIQYNNLHNIYIPEVKRKIMEVK